MTLDEIKEVLSCPSARRWSGDDYHKDIDIINPNHTYFKCEDNEGVCGFFLFVPKSSVEYDSHVAFKRSSWGKTLEHGFKAIEFMSGMCSKLTCEIPVDNRMAINYAIRLGFKIEGLNRSSFMRNGSLINKLHLGLEI